MAAWDGVPRETAIEAWIEQLETTTFAGQLGQHGPVILVCDRYSAYKALRKLLPETFVLAYCWAHQRRDFDRAAAGLPDLQEWLDSWLERIGRLFQLAKLRLRYIVSFRLSCDCAGRLVCDGC